MENKQAKGEYMIDKFLAKFEQRPDLENLRKELKVYANELHTAMTEILKTETEAIVNLAEHLTNLNAKVSELSFPIFQLHEEIKTLYTVIKNAEDSLETYREKAKIIEKERDNLNMQITMQSTSLYVNYILSRHVNEYINDLAVLERAVNEFSFQNTYLKELYAENVKKDDATIEIEDTFKLIMDEIFVKSLKHNMPKSIVCCLRAYVNLNQQSRAETLHAEQIAGPVLKKIFTVQNLELHRHQINLLYAEALDFLNNDMKTLVHLINSNIGLKGFNFIINSYWNLTNKLLQENLSHITAPGNPELFQRRFSDTWQFLCTIANKVDPSLIYDQSFQEHMKRFNLPVYFEIRFQQITASFETDILANTEVNSNNITNTHKFLKLKVSAALWRSMNHCFHPEVFLPHLADQFVKLSLLLLSRLFYYIDTLTKEQTPPPSEVFVVHLILDIESLKEHVGTEVIGDIGKSIYKVLPKKVWVHIESLVRENEKNLDTNLVKLKNFLINYRVGESSALLQQISAIPRLYRRTNKFAPTEASNYIVEVVTPIEQFFEKNKNLLKRNIETIMDESIYKIAKIYINLVEEVLHSVCKTEESLRRLKSRNINVIEEGASSRGDLTTDEDKIREQIRLDVKYFVEHMTPYVLERGKGTLMTLTNEAGCSTD